MSQLDKHGKGIILMHDLHRNTAEALPELISQLKAGGYKVVHTLSEGMKRMLDGLTAVNHSAKVDGIVHVTTACATAARLKE